MGLAEQCDDSQGLHYKLWLEADALTLFFSPLLIYAERIRSSRAKAVPLCLALMGCCSSRDPIIIIDTVFIGIAVIVFFFLVYIDIVGTILIPFLHSIIVP